MTDIKTNPAAVAPQTRTPAVPVHPWASLRSEIDRLFEDFSNNFGLPSFGRTWQIPAFGTTFAVTPFKTPVVDMTEDDKAYRIAAELPGLTQANVTLTLQGEMLMLKAERKAESTRDDTNVHISERSFGHYQRAFPLPHDVDLAKIGASFANGVLTIMLPKAESLKPATRTIEVKSAEAKTA